jgi:uncharacterized protein YaiI (UPF0178 family)
MFPNTLKKNLANKIIKASGNLLHSRSRVYRQGLIAKNMKILRKTLKRMWLSGSKRRNNQTLSKRKKSEVCQIMVTAGIVNSKKALEAQS